MEYNDIKTPKQLMNFLEANMKYGFTYRGKVYTELETNFQQNMDKMYKLRTGNDLIKNGYGVCWDFCEFERLIFKQLNLKHECYFVLSFITREQGGPTHSFTLYNKGNNWFWFEYSWLAYRGIHKYNTKEEALNDIINKFKAFSKVKTVDLYKINKAKARLNTYEYVEHCLHQEKIEL